MTITLILLPALGGLFYLLYIHGLLVISMKRAVMYIGSMPEKQRCKARFISCSGYTKRAVRFEKSETYRFMLDDELKHGELAVELLDAKKQLIMRLDAEHGQMRAAVDKGKRYDLIIRFKSASGSYVVSWDSN